LPSDRRVKRRDRLYIIAQILELAKEPITKPDMMYGARMSFSQTLEYLAFLLEIGCLEQIAMNGETAYRATKKGLAYLENYTKLMAFLKKEADVP